MIARLDGRRDKGKPGESRRRKATRLRRERRHASRAADQLPSRSVDMRVPRTLRTATFVVLPLFAAACMGAFPTEIPPTPGATHADRVMSNGALSNGSTATATAHAVSTGRSVRWFRVRPRRALRRTGRDDKGRL